MLWAVWAGLALLVVVTVVGAIHVVREGFALWRAIRSLTGFLNRASAVLAARTDDAARKAAATSDAAQRLTVSLERLSRSVAYARVISGSGGGALAAYAALRLRMPRK